MTKGQNPNWYCNQAQTQTITLNNDGATLEMVSIPGGQFQMGSSRTARNADHNEKPLHTVTIKSFWMSKYPITQVQWRTVAAFPKIERDLDPDPSFFKGANLPVERVSWSDTIEFCARLSKARDWQYRLPSEAEWEFACRAGTTSHFGFGENLTPEQANHYYYWQQQHQRQGKTTSVGSFPGNSLGLYDMHGNVYEWCLDHWHEDYEGAPTDEKPWLSNEVNQERVIRGGFWLSYPNNCRSAHRNFCHPEEKYNCVGFRIVGECR